MNERVNNFLLNNKEKIIVLIDSFLGEDINKTVFFNKSNFKVLTVPDKNNVFFRTASSYDENDFDIVIKRIKKIV